MSIFMHEAARPAGRKQLHFMPSRERQVSPDDRAISRQYGAERAKALTDFREYRESGAYELPMHFVTGGFFVVVKSKAETPTEGNTVRIFVWADSRAQSVQKALSFLPAEMFKAADQYIVTTMSAGRIDPEQLEGVIRCRP
jgi:hypothetical protein